MTARDFKDEDRLRVAIEAARSDVGDAEQMRRLAARLNLSLPPDAWNDMPAKPGLGMGHGLMIGTTSITLLALGIAWLSGGTAPRQAPSTMAPQTKAEDVHALEGPGDSTNAPPQSPIANTSDPAPKSVVADVEAGKRPNRSRRRGALQRRAGGQGRREAVLPSDLRAELTLLRQARQALGNDVTEARELLRQHEDAYPKGVFVQEREMLWIDVLREQGQTEQAAARARTFADRFPNSPHRRRIQPTKPQQ